ncbi:MAG: pantoate--beta-alanine ligase, partial [Ginsengibacter sp.]
HKGHLSLIRESKKSADITVASIFVNPTQFNNQEDLEKYPKSDSKDILMLEENGCDVLFLPSENEIYPDKKSKQKHFDLGYLETILEGKYRPGHFQGVCLVVEKLLNTINPDILFLGQKDFQQYMVIKRLIKLTGKKTKLVSCPIFREGSGLAMSSRNERLNNEERELASELHTALEVIKNNIGKQNFLELKFGVMHELESKGFKIEYLELAKQNDLEIISEFEPGENLIVLIAAYLGNVRLIDNVLIMSN